MWRWSAIFYLQSSLTPVWHRCVFVWQSFETSVKWFETGVRPVCDGLRPVFVLWTWQNQIVMPGTRKWKCHVGNMTKWKCHVWNMTKPNCHVGNMTKDKNKLSYLEHGKTKLSCWELFKTNSHVSNMTNPRSHVGIWQHKNVMFGTWRHQIVMLGTWQNENVMLGTWENRMSCSEHDKTKLICWKLVCTVKSHPGNHLSLGITVTATDSFWDSCEISLFLCKTATRRPSKNTRLRGRLVLFFTFLGTNKISPSKQSVQETSQTWGIISRPPFHHPRGRLLRVRHRCRPCHRPPLLLLLPTIRRRRKLRNSSNTLPLITKPIPPTLC